MAHETDTPEAQRCFIHAPIEEIFKAFIEPMELRAWLGLELDLVLELGGKYALSGEEGGVMGTIEVVAWPEALSVTWATGRFDLSLTPDFGGTEVSLSLEGAPHLAHALKRLEAHMTRGGRR